MKIINIKDLNLYNKKILIRSDFNVPIEKGKILSDIKILYSLETIKYALKFESYVIVCSHLGNPNGIYIDKFSLEPICKYLENKLKIKVKLIKDYLNGIDFFSKNILYLLENVRFNKGEIENDNILSEKYSNLCDIFVMDAFASSHRKHSSTYGIFNFVKQSCSGILFYNEYNNLLNILNKNKKPMISIVGGSKISNKIKVLEKLSDISDKVFVGGGVANTLLHYKGINIGNSLIENNLKIDFEKILNKKNIILPEDVKITYNFSKKSNYINKNIDNISDNDIILDLGIKTIEKILYYIKISKTLLWSGPIGMFEFCNFSIGTKLILNEIYNNKKLISILGGGDTLYSLEKFNYLDKISYLSTGGGAFLKFIENQSFPFLKYILKINK